MSHTGKITAVLAGLAFLSGGLAVSANGGMHYVAAENRFLGPEISCELSEEASDAAIKTALIEGLEIPQKELSGTRWYYDYVDLSEKETYLRSSRDPGSRGRAATRLSGLCRMAMAGKCIRL